MPKRRRRCERCGELKDDVKRIEDPYRKELYDESVKMLLCDKCVQDRADDM